MSDTGAHRKPAVLTRILLWVAKLVSASMLAHAAFEKLTGDSHAIEMFTLLEMEPSGRLVIGVIEALATLLILLPQSSVYGALLGLGVMIGATIAHLTVLGCGHLPHAAAVTAGCLTILYLRRDDAGFLRNLWDR
ncbi:MAG: DoxX family protein [Verrucomicrobiales bacterium]